MAPLASQGLAIHSTLRHESGDRISRADLKRMLILLKTADPGVRTWAVFSLPDKPGEFGSREQ
jgi:hypothetical protein